MRLMIPTKNRSILIESIRSGRTILEACADSQISKASLYRILKADYNFKAIFDEAIFYANRDKDTKIKKVEEDKMSELKKIVLRKKA